MHYAFMHYALFSYITFSIKNLDKIKNKESKLYAKKLLLNVLVKLFVQSFKAMRYLTNYS